MLSWDWVSDGKHASPLLQNLEVGASTDEALEGCMLHLESKNMSPFLEKVRQKEACGHFAISLYSELAQVHKQAITPFIPRIMASIVRSLSFSNGGSHMHAACARVMGSVARYTIDSTKPPHLNHEILFNLCSPLLAVLCGKLEPARLGAAVCLQALVESENWRFAQADLQSILCDKVSCALSQTASPDEALLRLTKSLIKYSRNAALGHTYEWLRVALQLLQTDLGRCGSILQQHIAATQLITSILKIADTEDILNLADAEKLYSDLQMATETMETCRLDVVPGLHTELAEALQAMRRLASGKSSISQHDSVAGDAGSCQQSCHLRHAKSCAQEKCCLVNEDLQISNSLTSGTLSTSSSIVAKSSVGLNQSALYCLKQMKEKYMHGSFASVVSPKIKESAQAIVARQACSDASTLPKVSSDNPNCLHALPKGIAPMCKAVNEDMSSLDSLKYSADLGTHMCIDTIGKRLPGKNCNADNSQNQSEIECTCSIEFVRREGSVRSRNVHEMDSKSVSEKDDKMSVECDESFLDGETIPISSSHDHETVCTNDSNVKPNRLADDVLCNGCTDLLLTPDSNNVAATSTSMGNNSLIKVVKSQVLMDNFGFTTPRRLLHVLQSAGKVDMQDGMDACQNHISATHFETSIDTPISSCCTMEDLDPSAGKDSKQSLHCRGQGFHRGLNGCDQFSLQLENCEIQAHGEGWDSLEGCSDENVLQTAGKKGNVESEGAIQQSSGLHCSDETENHTKFKAKMKIEGGSGKIKKGQITIPKKDRTKEMLMGACIGVVFTVAMLVFGLLLIGLINYSTNDLQVLVPT